MSYGFLSVNDNNIVQIDSTYLTFSVIESGTVVTNSKGWFASFDMPSADVILIRNVNPNIYIGYWGSHGYFGDLTTFQAGGTLANHKAPNQPIEYVKLRAVDAGAVLGQDNYGLEVFNSDGLLVFSSRNALYSYVGGYALTSTQVRSSSDINFILPTLEPQKKRYFNISACSAVLGVYRNDNYERWTHRAISLSNGQLLTKQRLDLEQAGLIENRTDRTIHVIDI